MPTIPTPTLAPSPARPASPPPGLRLFDGLAPFFVGHDEGAVNWSKIPFKRLERDGTLDEAMVERVLAEFEAHVAKMAEFAAATRSPRTTWPTSSSIPSIRSRSSASWPSTAGSTRASSPSPNGTG